MRKETRGEKSDGKGKSVNWPRKRMCLFMRPYSRCSNRGAMKVWEESNGEAIQANKAAVKPCHAKVGLRDHMQWQCSRDVKVQGDKFSTGKKVASAIGVLVTEATHYRRVEDIGAEWNRSAVILRCGWFKGESHRPRL